MSSSSAEITVLNLEDGSKTTLTHNEVRDGDPSWNADGSDVYYFQFADGGKTLFRQKPGQKDAVAVAEGDVVSNRGFVTRTRLSPNGRFLSYHKQVDGFYGLYIYDLELNQERRLIGASAK